MNRGHGRGPRRGEVETQVAEAGHDFGVVAGAREGGVRIVPG